LAKLLKEYCFIRLEFKSNPAAYEQAVGWTGLVNGWYNIVTFLNCICTSRFAKIWSKYVHAFYLLLQVVVLVFPTHRIKLLFFAITGFMGWARKRPWEFLYNGGFHGFPLSGSIKVYRAQKININGCVHYVLLNVDWISFLKYF
jgi:hypothetical protein